MTVVPVTGVDRWVLYIKYIICMLQVWVHCSGISYTIAFYGIGTINSDCDCQHGISYYRIYRSRFGVSVWIVSAEFVSSRCCWTLSTWNLYWDLNFRFVLETWIFNWDSHICRIGHVFTTAKLLLNNVLYYQSFIVISTLS